MISKKPARSAARQNAENRKDMPSGNLCILVGLLTARHCDSNANTAPNPWRRRGKQGSQILYGPCRAFLQLTPRHAEVNQVVSPKWQRPKAETASEWLLAHQVKQFFHIQKGNGEILHISAQMNVTNPSYFKRILPQSTISPSSADIGKIL